MYYAYTVSDMTKSELNPAVICMRINHQHKTQDHDRPNHDQVIL